MTRARISRSTSHWRSGVVLTTIRMVTSVLNTCCAPHTSGFSSMTPRQTGSFHMASAAVARIARMVARSAV